MEWKTKPFPEVGQHRERLKFAWLPVECADGVTRWLCKVRVLEVYNGAFFDGVGARGPVWETVNVYRAEFEAERK